ncbi:MAG TPA: zinc-finger-containing protein [Steroidobacter sp.]|uniref:zinc-finger-containing protein n=1 Tax=Steroidobacter sp. TaxID=1978227 RepID=UPI002ED8531C
MSALLCTVHNVPARFRKSSAHIYGRDYGSIWECPHAGCDSYVGCHPDGSPKGTLANRALRNARKAAHASFDPLWQDWAQAYPDMPHVSGRIRQLMRRRAYEWLAEQLQLPFDQTHIAMFDHEQCARVVAVIAVKKPNSATVRAWAKARKEAA